MRKGYIPCSTELELCLCIGCADLCATPCRRTFPGPAAGCSQHSRRNRARTRNPTTCSETNLAGKIPSSRTGKMNLVYQIHCRRAGWTNLVQQIPSSRTGRTNLAHQIPAVRLDGRIWRTKFLHPEQKRRIWYTKSLAAGPDGLILCNKFLHPEQEGRIWCNKSLATCPEERILWAGQLPPNSADVSNGGWRRFSGCVGTSNGG